jgi:hypothetical protein
VLRGLVLQWGALCTGRWSLYVSYAQDKLSTRLSLNTSFSAKSAGVAFSYGAYRLGNGSAPLVFHADIASVAADPRAAMQYHNSVVLN